MSDTQGRLPVAKPALPMELVGGRVRRGVAECLHRNWQLNVFVEAVHGIPSSAVTIAVAEQGTVFSCSDEVPMRTNKSEATSYFDSAAQTLLITATCEGWRALNQETRTLAPGDKKDAIIRIEQLPWVKFKLTVDGTPKDGFRVKVGWDSGEKTKASADAIAEIPALDAARCNLLEMDADGIYEFVSLK